MINKVIFFAGCPTEDLSVPFETREFGWYDYLKSAKQDFIGRSWLYREVESVLDHPFQGNGITGVLIIGDPGTGKSAVSAQLVCSRTSSRAIHDHILGYHLCKHSDKNTQSAGKFVRNLAGMIAQRIPEYGILVSNSSYILRSLQTDCITNQDPVGCFEQAVLSPLKSLKNIPKEKWFIVVDALDECLAQTETSHSIVYLLNNKPPRFPFWLKLVMTCRNESRVSFNSDAITKLNFNPGDPRNMEDIELFLTMKLYRQGPLLYKIRSWFGDSSIETAEKLISALVSKSQGNFLFVKEMIHHWESSKVTNSDPYALPENLGELYHSFFQRLYDGRELFKPAQRVLEILVATFHPMTERDIFDVLKTNEKNLEGYAFRETIKELGHFIRYGENETLTLYHLSLTEWLTSERNKHGLFYVSKKRGHEVFCDYYFRLITDGDNFSLPKHILTLARHIAYGGWKEEYVKEFLSFPSQVVNSSDPESNKTLLHLAATINSTDVLELLLHHFSCIDCTDSYGVTPAFLAAEHGLVNNLALLTKKGAKVNRKTKSIVLSYTTNREDKSEIHDKDLSSNLHEIKSKFRGATMLHAAAQRGHLKVKFLLDNGAFISAVSDANLTALQVAAENGHFEVVEALYKSGGVADQIALHHAAVNNRLKVVKYLLDIGVEDKCMRCDGSLYWLKTKHRAQSRTKRHHVRVPVKSHCKPQYETQGVNGLDDECFDRDKISKGAYFGELFDDKHLIFCETALHAAVSSGHNSIVKELVSRDTRTLACHDYSGRTPMHEAVRTNNSEMVQFLLKKDASKVRSTCDHWQNIRQQDDAMPDLLFTCEESIDYHGDVCHCGYTPLHLAARYGHWKIALNLLKAGAAVGAQDCSGATPLHVAACHNHLEMILLLLNRGAQVLGRTFNRSTPLHSAAACGAVKAIRFLLYHGASLDEVDESAFTPLHYTIRTTNSSHLDEKFLLNVSSKSESYPSPLVSVDRRGKLAKFFKENYHWSNTLLYPWLDALLCLILHGADINAVDLNGRTALHLAAENGLADAVNVLLQRKAKLEIRDKTGKTPLELAVEKATVLPEHLHFILLGKSFDEMKGYLRDHDMVVYLLLSSGVSFTKCNRSGESLLHRAVLNNQPYIAKLLLMKGANKNCKDKLERTPLVAFLQNGGDWPIAKAVFFNGPVKIECGKPLDSSVFHLMCYHSPKLEGYNFFQQISCDNRKCSSKKSPLVTAIENHPLKYKVIDSCLDAEGFTPLQRAAQGANLIAVRNLIKHGANVSLRSPQGHDALTLAILQGGNNVWSLFRSDRHHWMDDASDVALELLHYKMKSGFQIMCDSRKAELTLYHLAASRGLIKFIKRIFKDRMLHKLHVDCPNKDGITPMYLAKLFSNLTGKGHYNSWFEVEQFIENQGGQLKYPSRETEYNVIYKRLHGWIPNDLQFNLRPDIGGFVVRLLSTYGHWPTSSMHCQINNLENHHLQIGSASLTLNLSKELLQSLPRCKGHHDFVCYKVRRALKDLELCQKHMREIRFLWLAFSSFARRVSIKAPLDLNLNNARLSFFYLMRIWHKEVFEHFACYKKIFDKYRPFFLDERKSKQLIQLYENSTPQWYVNNICFDFELAYQAYLLHYSKYPELMMFYHVYPTFVRERMGWTVHQLSGYNGSWPIEFLVKFSLGLYRHYDYLKILNVGLEPKTYVSLYSDELREIIKNSFGRFAD
ncbi:ankyrin repeat domain-containing protein 50-like [Stylophora pistillata]|uniref:ankyrin repeat domain-containing protein 50-like n=1 Tax=Stylophora pistillata TaxID=50429 RepID=UPI000C03C370|nr:ankyrin repeat domain-containing protein 50-like [Stylophora pistillata]